MVGGQRTRRLATMPRMNIARRCLLLGSFALFAACTAKTPPEAPKPAAGPAAPITAEVIAKLAAADAKDGKTDKVVHLCAGCSLGMDGDEKFPLKVQDYTMHFCKQGCLDKFQPDPAKAILAMQPK